MRFIINNFKIFYSVVRFVVVFMVYDFKPFEISTNKLLHNISVLINSFSANIHKYISVCVGIFTLPVGVFRPNHFTLVGLRKLISVLFRQFLTFIPGYLSFFKFRAFGEMSSFQTLIPRGVSFLKISIFHVKNYIKIAPLFLVIILISPLPAYSYNYIYNPNTGRSDAVGAQATADLAIPCDSGKILKSQGGGVYACSDDAGASSGAPTDARYLVDTANGSLSDEIVVQFKGSSRDLATVQGDATAGRLPYFDSSGDLQASNVASGDLLTASSTNTFTNKTINTASNTITVVEADISDLAHTTDTNANTACSGTTTYLDGEGNCDDIGANTGDVTLAGTPDYITIAGQVITRGTIDIGDDTNLVGGTNITLSGDTLNVDDAFILNTGDSGTGTYNFGGADQFELPNSATYSPGTTTGQLGLDTTITSYDGLFKYYDGATEMTIVAVPTADLTTTDNDVVAYATAKSGFNMEAQAGGGSGAKNITLRPQQAKITGSFVTHTPAGCSTTASTQGAQIEGGSGSWKGLFDATTDEAMVWQGVIPDNYSSSPVLDVHFSMASAEANEVEWEGAIMCYTPTTDTANVDTASFANCAVGTATTVSATAGEVYSQSITLTDDSCSAGDDYWVWLSTDSDDATNDDATGDRELINAELSYS